MGLLPMNASILPPSDDRVFKLVLTAPEAKPALMDLISAIIRRPVLDVVVRNNDLPADDISEKAVRLDVNCRIDDGSQIDFEMQASRIEEETDGQFRNIKGKSIYYLCDLHASQSAKGIRRYDSLARTYQVTFCSYTVFKNRESYVNSFSLRHDEDNELLSDAVQMVFVELSKLSRIVRKSVGDMTDLEKWAVFFRYASDTAHRETVNAVIASKEVLQVAGNLLMSISQDERERAIFRSRRMYQTDMASNLATVEDRGRKEGIQIGEQRGMQIGAADKAHDIARNMLAARMPVEQIAVLTGLTVEEIAELKVQ